jgi:ADP-ribose pyrophosphatase
MNEVKKTVFRTDWFDVEQVSFPGIAAVKDDLYYRINSPDGIIVLATTAEGDLVLVRQFRPALGTYTLEFPAGAIDPGETPEQAARRELEEETGFQAVDMVSLGAGHMMMNRHNTLLHAFYAPRMAGKRREDKSDGVETMIVKPRDFKRLVLEGAFDQYAALALVTRLEWQAGIRLLRE